MMNCESEMEGMSEELFLFIFSNFYFLRNYQGSEETVGRKDFPSSYLGVRSNYP